MRSPPSMARGIVLPMKADTRNHDGQKPEGSIAEQEESPLVWSARWSLTTRILAVNSRAVALLAGGFYYLDTYRSRLVDTRIEVMKDQLAMLDSALEAARPDQRTTLIREFTKATESRLRFYRADGRRVSDSFASGPPTYTLRDPELQPWKRDAARPTDPGHTGRANGRT